MDTGKTTRAWLAALTLAILAGAGGAAFGDEYADPTAPGVFRQWVGPAGGEWYAPANWSPSGQPADDDQRRVYSGSPQTWMTVGIVLDGDIYVAGPSSATFHAGLNVGLDGYLRVYSGGHVWADWADFWGSSGTALVEQAMFTVLGTLDVDNTCTVEATYDGVIAANRCNIYNGGEVKLSTGGTLIADVLSVQSGYKLTTTGNAPVRVNTLSGVGSTPMLGGAHLQIGHGGGSGSGSFSRGAYQSFWCDEVTVGYDAPGTLTLHSGGCFASNTGNIASRAGSLGHVIVDGVGSTWTAYDAIYVGGSYWGAGGTGTLTVKNGGLVTGPDDVLKVWGSGRVDLQDGSIIAEKVQLVSGATFNTSSGSELIVNSLSGFGSTPWLAGCHIKLGHLGGSGSGSHTIGAYQSWMCDEYSVGHTSAGALRLQDGGCLTCANGNIRGGMGGGSSATVEDAGSTWVLTDSLYVGGDSSSATGSGTLTVKDAGLVNVANTLVIWGTGAVKLNGGTIVAGAIDKRGSTFNWTAGKLKLTNSGLTLDTDTPDELFGSSLTIGANKTLELSSLSAGILTVGATGSGTLRVASGGAVASSTAYVARDAGSTGNVTVDGTGSTLKVNGWLYLGGDAATAGGAGTLTINTGGTVTVTRTLAHYTHGTINLAGGTLQAGDIDDRGSTFNWTAGTLELTGAGMTFDSNTPGIFGSSMTVGVNKTLGLAGGLTVGATGSGSLEVADGGHVAANNGYIARYGGSAGLVTVHGTDSTLEIDESLYVGGDGTAAGGTATLNVYPGGTVTVDDDLVLWTNGTVNHAGGTVVAATIDRRGSTYNWTSGRLELTQSGLVLDSNTPDPIFGSSLTLGGDKELDLWQNVVVADTGTGSLMVVGGGGLANWDGYVGFLPGSLGTAVVDGVNSTWVNSDVLCVGESGSGELLVSGGGFVLSSQGGIGASAGGIGTVTVTGAGSTWASEGSLHVGGNPGGAGGTGALSVADDGTVNVGNTLQIWDAGTVNLLGGTISTGALNKRPAGTFNWTAGTLEYTNSDLTIDTATPDSVFGSSLSVGPGKSLRLLGNLWVGAVATGTLQVTGGGAVLDNVGTLGWQGGSRGAATVTGEGSTWTNGPLFVGWYGAGRLTVSDGAEVSSLEVYVGAYGGSAGAVMVDNATLTSTGLLYLADQAVGSLTVRNGGTVSNTIARIGGTPGSFGTAVVEGGGSSWASSGPLVVGEFGQGSLTVGAGGSVSSSHCYLGVYTSGGGAVSVGGTDAALDVAMSMYVGGGVSSPGGAATLSVTGNGTATVGDTLKLWPPGTVGVSGGGMIVADKVDRTAGGTFNTSSGAYLRVNKLSGFGNNINLSGTHFQLGHSGGSGLGTHTVGAGQTFYSEQIWIGYDAPAIMNVSGGGRLTNYNGFVAELDGSLANVTVQGGGSNWQVSNHLKVARSGAGFLTISSGGAVSDAQGFVGERTGGSGHVVVSAGSSWSNSDRLYVGGSYYSGGGAGELKIEGGGTVSSPLAYVGFGADAVGTVTVSGAGSTWSTTGSLHVGYNGTGRCVQTGGSADVTGELYLGYSAGASGSYTLAGGNLSVGGTVHVGHDGTGRLSWTGGALSTDAVTIGPEGTMTVAQDWYFAGTLAIEGGALEMAPHALTLEAQLVKAGSASITGGSLSAGEEHLGFEGAGGINQTGGTNAVSNTLYLGYWPSAVGTYELGGTGELLAANQVVGYFGQGEFVQTGGVNTAEGVLFLGLDEGGNGVYTISGGSLTANEFFLGMMPWCGGVLDIQDASAEVTVTGVLYLGVNGGLDAVEGSVIHMSGSTLINESTDPGALAGLENVRLIFEGGTEIVDGFEVAGGDAGPIPEGWYENFAVGALQLGEAAAGRIELTNFYTNTWKGPEALYVHELVLNAGARIVLNDLNLYYLNGGDPKQFFQGDANLDGAVDYLDLGALATHYDMTGTTWAQGDFNGDDEVNFLDLGILATTYGQYTEGVGGAVPEPATLALLVLPAVVLLRARRRRGGRS